MKALLTDFDGVLLRSEFAKAAEWFIASLYIQGRLSGDFIKDLENEKQEALKQIGGICDKHKEEFKEVANLSGMSRKDTRDAVWRLSKYAGSIYACEDLEKIRGNIKRPIEYHHSERIEGNIKFFEAAKRGRLELGLITQAKEKEVREISKAFNLHLDNLFSRLECTGDDFYKEIGKPNNQYAPLTDKKAVGYRCLCRILDVNPWETITIEDSESGVKAANSAGVVCIGVKEDKNKQDLSKAALIVPSDLGVLANDGIIDVFRNKNPMEIIFYINDYLEKRNIQSTLREDYKS